MENILWLKKHSYYNKRSNPNKQMDNKDGKVKRINIFEKIIKRAIDIVAGLVGFILLIPVTLLIFVLRLCIKKERGPVFYMQERIGKNGKHFKLIKFRTMIVGADKILEQYLKDNPEAKKEFDANQKLRNDPRITKLGNFLRKASIDEIPQFINVLVGQMSLIGPRPIVDREVKLFGESMPIVEQVKPGITGYWAVNGRSDTTYEERVAMERYYVEHYSLWLDLKIFFKTIGTIFEGKGAI